jgi:hypothetical protein
MDDFYCWETGMRFKSFVGDSQKYLFEVISNICSQSAQKIFVDYNFGCDLIDRSIY